MNKAPKFDRKKKVYMTHLAEIVIEINFEVTRTLEPIIFKYLRILRLTDGEGM